MQNKQTEPNEDTKRGIDSGSSVPTTGENPETTKRKIRAMDVVRELWQESTPAQKFGLVTELLVSPETLRARHSREHHPTQRW